LGQKFDEISAQPQEGQFQVKDAFGLGEPQSGQKLDVMLEQPQEHFQ
jgi:hypothetical protein